MQTVKLGGGDPPSGRLDFSAASAEEPSACEWKFMVSARSSCYYVQSSCYNVQNSCYNVQRSCYNVQSSCYNLQNSIIRPSSLEQSKKHGTIRGHKFNARVEAVETF